MKAIKLFLEFLKIGAFSFGGGMGTLPYIYEMCNKTGWISEEYIGKVLAVSQVTPGPLACNIGTITGFRVNGIFGAFVANLGFIVPAILFMTISYKLLNKIKNNKKANEVIKIVRSSALAVMLASADTLFKNAFLLDNFNYKNYNFENLNIINLILKLVNVLNYKNIILAISIFIFICCSSSEKCKLKKINSLWLIFISAGIAIIFKI